MIRETNGNLTHAAHVNGWFPAVYMSRMSQNFRLFQVSNLSVRNFRIFLLMYTESLTAADGAACQPAGSGQTYRDICWPAAQQAADGNTVLSINAEIMVVTTNNPFTQVCELYF